jgi:translation initiation factor IF-3
MDRTRPACYRSTSLSGDVQSQSWFPGKEANRLQHRCNEQIRISPIRLIDHNNNQMGVVPTDEARRMAMDAGMDLVEVAPTERPPVCRIMDYGKFKYGQKKKKQKHHEQKLKEVRLHPKIGDADRDRLMRRAAEFLEEGDKVQLTMIFRGRERFHQDLGQAVFNAIIAQLGENVKVERPVRNEGRRMTMVLAPGIKKPIAPAPKPAGPPKPRPAPPVAPAVAPVVAPVVAEPASVEQQPAS